MVRIKRQFAMNLDNYCEPSIFFIQIIVLWIIIFRNKQKQLCVVPSGGNGEGGSGAGVVDVTACWHRVSPEFPAQICHAALVVRNVISC